MTPHVDRARLVRRLAVRGILERTTKPSNVPTWDRILLRVYPALLGCLFVVAALDAGRYRWAPVPLTLQWPSQ